MVMLDPRELMEWGIEVINQSASKPDSNALLAISDSVEARAGTRTTWREWFQPGRASQDG